ncbi:MAG TPA: acetyl/propionyl/methylcrotonyl-CoA carboxylase subunit alpha [Candidatus Competibacteraceae bacterium]|nr:MAG: acetyl/propionyl/methylcrotonyl-CoA carboxylase subunit alpha [Candidatus Competibacteraceae bacterium]HQA27047.1 acetyl/propionyl/methylcrotonyl-CoA carboxylase subunit alpha [Candidatus Competibacteraceae bacterium]HQD57725.1 acetyl/propionyl/methylcrotonyl-CoA carboxylase subunit alpha [Candidatus Competibacteraceae bacterium]
MFKKILIANRGEIACRVIKTARKMGIKTVAVYSEADKDALHVEMADEAVFIGPPPSTQSYLLIDRIVQACKDTGAEAVHPGYGFLSERPAFCEALEKEGIVFIGPKVKAIEAMGDKITSKKLAKEAGVSTVPGYTEIIKNPQEAVEIAASIGYPVMIKASAGGGGKGMRIAWNDAECTDGFERATNEARSSFGDDRVFIEKYIVEPRHIEIQVLGDSHGNIVYLGERECSLQRRNQKVIEEAPSPFLDEATRKAMGEQAVMLARAVDYQSAGTVEFIVDAKRNFYFLEMNTRLQVEHPVTEYITGLDLVEQMLRVAAGEPLSFTQDDVKLKGWAIEARVYAEDPFRNFLPSIGRLVKYMPPQENEVVRVDTGVYEGGEVSMYYDPMIAKLITYGATRDRAIAHMRDALNEFFIRGVQHNISFLAALMVHTRFMTGRISTNMIAEEYPHGFSATDVPHDDPALLISVAAFLYRRYMDRAAQISGQLLGHERKVGSHCVVVMGGQQHPVQIDPAEGGYDAVYMGETYQIRSDWQFGYPLFKGTLNGTEICIQVERRGMVYRLFHWGSQADVVVLSPRVAKFQTLMPEKAPPDLSKFLLSPMPGLLTKVAVQAGQEVKAGEELAVIEAMKMENVLRADHDSKVAKVMAGPGDSLAVDQAILEFE